MADWSGNSATTTETGTRTTTGAPGRPAGFTQVAPEVRTTADWYGGRNLRDQQSGWNTGWYEKAVTQYNEQIDRQAESGNPEDFYNWFQRDDATGVATWNDPGRIIEAENGTRRGLRAGDTFEDGEFQGNVYDQEDKGTADLLVGEFVFDGAQKARLFERDQDLTDEERRNGTGAYGRELEMAIEENSKLAEHGQQAYEYRMAVEERQEELAEGSADTWRAFITGAGGGAAAGSIFGLPGAAFGALAGGFFGVLNQDRLTEGIARAQVQADLANNRGLEGSALLTGAAEVATFAVSPFQNLVAGSYEMVKGGVGDGVNDFGRVDPATGERIAGGGWQSLHLLSSAGDAFASFGSRNALRAYQASLTLHIGGKGLSLSQDMVFSDAEGNWHKFEDWGERSGGYTAFGIDALQLGVSQWAVRAAQYAKSGTTGGEIPANRLERGIDRAWAALPGKGYGGTGREGIRTSLAQSTRPPEALSGGRFFFNAQGVPVGYRPTAVAFVPSEMSRFLPAHMMARYKAIRAGRRPGEVTVEDLYEASLRMAGNGGRMSDAMLNAFAEGSEEMAQYFFDTQSYSGRFDAGEMYMAGAYGAMAGLGMGMAPLLSRASTEQQMRANGLLLEMVRTGRDDITEQEWDQRWAAMSEAERRRASVGSKEEVAEAKSIARAIALRHLDEVDANGILPATIAREAADSLKEGDTGRANSVTEGAQQAKLLANELMEKPRGKKHRRKGPLFEHSQWAPNASATTSRSLLRRYQVKLRALKAERDAFDDSTAAEARASVEGQIDILEFLTNWLDRQSRRMAGQSVEDRAATIKMVNYVLQQAAQNGDLYESKGADRTDIDAEIVRRAAQVVYARHPYIDEGSVFHTIPQVHGLYEQNNMHGSVGVGIGMAKVAQLDFDGDTLGDLIQVTIPEDRRAAMEAGAHYMTEVHTPIEGGGTVLTWKIQSSRPKDEEKLITRIAASRTGVGDLVDNDPRDRAVRDLLKQARKTFKRRWSDLLRPTRNMPDPFAVYWRKFERSLLRGDPAAVETFLQDFVDHDGGQGGQALRDLGNETHLPELLSMGQMMSTTLENIDRLLKYTDPVLMKRVIDKQDTADIPEMNRRLIKAVAQKDAADEFQTMQLLYGYDGTRAAQHAAYAPWMQYAIDLTLARPGDHLTEQEIALVQDFFVESGPGRAESVEDATINRNSTVRRVQAQLEEMSKYLNQHVAESAITTELLPDKGLAMLVAGMRSADVREDGFYSRDGDRGRGRSDISLGQLLLRHSVMQDRARHRGTRADDPIHSNLNRLGNMSQRDGARSITAFQTVFELYGDTPFSELLPEEQAAALGPASTMRSLLEQYLLIGPDALRLELDNLKMPGIANAYVDKHTSDAPWTLPEIQQEKLTAYTLVVDTIAAIANHQTGLFARTSAKFQGEANGSLTALAQLVDHLYHKEASRIRKFFGYSEGRVISRQDAVNYALESPQIVNEVKLLFPHQSREATFRVDKSDGQVRSKRWVGEVLREKDVDRAELMILVESAIDLLNATGARIQRDPETGKVLESRPSTRSDQIESRLAILINELAQRPSDAELLRFFEIYARSRSVDAFFAEINRETSWIGNRPPLFPYVDSVKEFETDPRFMWSAGHMNSERFQLMTQGIGQSARLQAVSASAIAQFSAAVKNTDTLAKLREVRDARAEGRKPDPLAEREAQRLEKLQERAQRIAVMHGANLMDQTMEATGLLLDLADKGAAPESMKPLGDAYILTSGIGLQPGVMQEFEQATAFTMDSVLTNPSLLMRGPATIQDGDGRIVEVDLTTLDGFIEAMEQEGMEALIYSAVFHTEMDVDAQGNLRAYSNHDPHASLSQYLSEADEVLVQNEDSLTDQEAARIIQLVDGHARQAGREKGSKEEMEKAFLPIQTLLHNIVIAYSSRSDWHLLSRQQQAAERAKARRKVGTLLFKMSQVQSREDMEELVHKLEALFVARWRAADNSLPGTLGEALREIYSAGVENDLAKGVVADYYRAETDRLFQELQDELNERVKREAQFRTAVANNDLARANDLKNQMDRLRPVAEIQAEMDELNERYAQIDAAQLDDLPMTAGMVNYRAAYNMYWTSKSDRSMAAQDRRKFLLKTLVDTDAYKRTGVGTASNLVERAREWWRSHPEELVNGTVEVFSQEDWTGLAVIAAKLKVAEMAVPSGSSVLFATTPSTKEEDGFHFWDESFSYLARVLTNPYVLNAVQWMGQHYSNGEVSPDAVAQYAMTSGPFAEGDFGEWTPLLASTSQNMVKATNGASVTLAVPIGGSLPKNQFDASVAGYSEWEAPVLDEHRSTAQIVLDSSRTDWFNYDNWVTVDADNGDRRIDPLTKLHYHFAKSYDINQITDRIAATFQDERLLAAFLRRRDLQLSKGAARQQAAEMIADGRAAQTALAYTEEYTQWIGDAFSTPSNIEKARQDFYLIDLRKLQEVLLSFDRDFGFETLQIDIDYVDVEKKPFTPEYRNHGMFDGVGRRSTLEPSISPFAAMMFGVGGISKKLQQQVFDYAKEAGTAYTPYMPTARGYYDNLVATSASASELIEKIAKQIMGKDYDSGKLLIHDYPGIYKLVKSRFAFRGTDPSGVERLMWAEEVIHLERQKPDNWSFRDLELVPISEEIFRLLHGASAMQAGDVVSRPEWNIDRIDKTPNLDTETLERLGLTELGRSADAGTTRLAMQMPTPKRAWRGGSPDTTPSSITRVVDDGLRRQVETNRWRTENADAKTLKNRRSNLQSVLKFTMDEHLNMTRQDSFLSMLDIPVMEREAAAVEDAKKVVEGLRTYYKDKNINARGWLYRQDQAADWEKGWLNEQSLPEQANDPGGVTWDDIAVIDLGSIMDKHKNDMDNAMPEAMAVIKWFAKRGAKIVLIAPGKPQFLNQVSAWMGTGATDYVMREGSKYVWEHVTPDTYRGATIAALESSLSASSSFLARNAHVAMHFNSLVGVHLDENAGALLRPEQLATPHTRKYMVLPTTLTSAKFGETLGEFMFGHPGHTSDAAELLRTDALTFLNSGGGVARLQEMAATIWSEEEQQYTQQKDRRGNSNPDPKNIELYRMFEDTGIEHPGVRSFRDAVAKLRDTLAAGRLPLYNGQTNLMAGDFVVLRDRKNRILFHRLGFEAPSSAELKELYSGGAQVAVTPPRIDKTTVIPPNFTIHQGQDDPRGGDYMVTARLDVWSKIVMQGDATKYTQVPLPQGYQMPEVMAGRNGRDVTFGTSSESQRSKFGYSRPGTGFKTIFAIAGMDDMRVPLVNTLRGKAYTRTTEKGFQEDWSKVLSMLEQWSNFNFGLTDPEIKKYLNGDQVFAEAGIEINKMLGAFDSLGIVNTLPFATTDFRDPGSTDLAITQIVLAVLMSPRIKPRHIISTPGVWTIKNPESSENGIIDMPDLFTDTLANARMYPHVKEYLLDKANARVNKFPKGHPMQGKPVGWWDEDFVYHQAMKVGKKWMYVDGWLSIDFPVTATQNTATYDNIAMLDQKSGFTAHVAQVLGVALDGRMLEVPSSSGQRTGLETYFGDYTEKFTEEDAANQLRKVLTLDQQPGHYTRPELLPAEIARIKQKRQAIREYDHRIDKSQWGDTNNEIDPVVQNISELIGVSNDRGGLSRQLDMMVRMFYGSPGPIQGQENWVEHVSSQDYLAAVQHFLKQLKKNLDPMQGGALALMPPQFAIAAYNAGRWAPAEKDGGTAGRTLATDWDGWVKSLFGQMLDSPMPLERIFLEEFDGLIQIWKDQAKTLQGLGLSLDTINDLLPKDRRVNETLDSIELLSARGREDPLVLEAWDAAAVYLRNERSQTDLLGWLGARAAEVEKHNTRRRHWLATNDLPKPARESMTVKNYMEDGHYLIKNKAQEHQFFSMLTNWSHITRLADPAIFASGYVEQPVRMMFEHITDLLTGSYRGPGAQRARKVLESEGARRITQSETVQKTLGFGDFQQVYTAEDDRILKELAYALGNDKRWLDLLYEDSEYMNLVQKGSGKITTASEKAAGFVARTFSDPLYGTSQYAAAMRYLTGAVENLHAQGIRVPIASLAVEMTKNPRFLQDQYGGPGLDTHMAGMNRVKQIRSQKLTPWSRAVKGSVDFLTSSPNRFLRLGGWMLNIPFAYTRFQMNGLQFISGMDGWSQAGAMFFAGRRRPKFLRGGVNGNPEYWDLEDVLETMDLRRTFVRSGATLTTLFTMGMLAGGTFAFGGEDEDERRRRKQAMYAGLIDYKDPREPENNFRNADAIFVDSIPILGTLFGDGEGANAIVPHWILRQFTSPIIGFSRFFETGDPREIGYGFLDAFSAVPYSVKRLWDEADATARMLAVEAEASAADPSAVGTARTMQMLVQMVGIYERALFEPNFINTLYVGRDRYDRDPWTVPDTDELGNIKIGPDQQPVPTDSLVQYYDDETETVKNAYLTRSGAEGVRYQYAENNAVFAHFMALITGQGFDSGYLRQNMVTRKRELELEETPEAKAEAAILGLYMQSGGLEGLTVEEIAYTLKDKYTEMDVWWDEDNIQEEAEAIHASGSPEGALSFMTPEGEVLTDWGGDRIIDGIVKGSIKLGSPELIGVSMDKDMRRRLGVTIQERLVQDGLDLGLPQKTAEYRASRFWYGEEDRPDVPGIREILWSDEIPYSNTVRYNQLNVLYTMGPDGKPWATPYERKTMMQAILPLPHNMITPGQGLKNDGTGSIIDEVLGINTGLAGIERIPTEPVDLEPDDSAFSMGDSEKPTGTRGYKRNYKPWSRYSRGGYGGGGGGGSSPFMRALPGGTAARFNSLQMINTSNPYIRRARLNRQRIWSERGRLKQWQ